jgi:hypothetical protein
VSCKGWALPRPMVVLSTSWKHLLVGREIEKSSIRCVGCQFNTKSMDHRVKSEMGTVHKLNLGAGDYEST